MSIILDGNNATTGGVINVGTAQNSTSGTAITFTGIPSTAKRITVMFNGVSTNGSSNVLVQLGSGTATTSGYLGASSVFTSAVSSTNYTNGLAIVISNAASSVVSGNCIITNLNANSWTMFGVLAFSNGAGTLLSASSVNLSNVLDRVIITTVNGTDTFDAGSINVFWE